MSSDRMHDDRGFLERVADAVKPDTFQKMSVEDDGPVENASEDDFPDEPPAGRDEEA